MVVCMSNELIETLVREGRIIEAIKRFRETEGCTLAEAKNAIDTFRDTGSWESIPTTRKELDLSKIQQLLQQDKKIQAIKEYRDCTGVGLAEAKQAIEGMQSQALETVEKKEDVTSTLIDDNVSENVNLEKINEYSIHEMSEKERGTKSLFSYLAIIGICVAFAGVFALLN